MKITLKNKNKAFYFLLIGLILFSAGLYYISFVTINKEIMQLESTMLPNRLPALSPPEKDLHIFKTLEIQKKKEEAVKKRFSLAIPQGPTLPKALMSISHRAKLSGIQTFSLKTQEWQETQDLHPDSSSIYLWPIIVSFESNYFQLAKFIHEIKNLKREIEILGIGLSRSPPGLQAEVQLAVYSMTVPDPITESKLTLKRK